MCVGASRVMPRTRSSAGAAASKRVDDDSVVPRSTRAGRSSAPDAADATDEASASDGDASTETPTCTDDEVTARAREKLGGKRARTEARSAAPSIDDLDHAYDILDAKKRGFFTARDLRRALDANGFADWSDARCRAMVVAFKPERARRALELDHDGALRMTREEFEDVVKRSGARAPC